MWFANDVIIIACGLGIRNERSDRYRMKEPELVITKYLDGYPIAWRCSVCDYAIRMPDEIFVSSREITEEFRRHCQAEHPSQTSV